MESRKKKSESCEIVDDDYYSLDPLLNISEDLYEMIFQHFDSQAFRTASTLNRHWYEATAMSKVCMRRIRLQIDFYGPPLSHDVTVFHSSIRKYLNIIIFCPNYFKLTETCLDILRCHAHTVVNLEVWGMNDRIYYHLEPMELPKLETLRFVDTEGNAACAMLLRSCSRLKVLNMLTSKYHSSIIECLQANKYIKELHLSRDVAYNLLVLGVPQFQFQLNKLFVKANVKEGYSDERFVKFLRTQRKLKMISLFGVSIEVVLTVMNELPLLSEIEYRSSPIRDYRPVTKCFPNNVMRILRFDNTFDSYSILKNILDACPGLEELTLHTVPVDLLNYIVITNFKLRRIFYQTDDEAQVAYKALKLTNYDLNRDITFIKI